MEGVQESERRNNLSVEDAINSLLNDLQESPCDEFLTRILFNISPDDKSDSSELINVLKTLAGPRQVCQYQFKANDIVWICRQCQKDETCVLCNDCYQKSCHDGHDVFFYHSAAGGCCDCGDYDAWDSKGFCSHHGNKVDDPVSFIPEELVERSSEIFQHLLSHMSEQFNHFAGLLNAEFNSSTALTLLPDDTSYSILLYYSEFHLQNELNEIISSPTVTSYLHSPGLTFTLEDANTGFKTLYTTWKVSPNDNDAHKLDVLDKANFLKMRGLQVAVFSSRDSARREIIVKILDWLQHLALINDGLCKLICKALDVSTLTSLMKVNMKLDRQICKRFHNWLITLMADQTFKMNVAIAYTKCLSALAHDHRLGFGIGSSSVFSLSVQYLNREFYVNEISYMYSFLSIVSSSLCDLILDESNTVDLKNKVMIRRRYNPVMSDLKIVFIVPEIGRFFVTSCMEEWLKLLTAVQYMHKQKRHIITHVDFEDRDWMNAFNLYLSLSSLFEHLFIWYSAESSIEPLETRITSVTKLAPSERPPSAGSLRPSLSIRNMISSGISFFSKSSSSNQATSPARLTENLSAKKESDSHYVAVNTLSSARDAFNVILSAVISWQRTFLMRHCSLFTVSSLHHNGTLLRFFEFPNMATEYSFHLPLHRFLSATISEALKYPHHLSTVNAALDRLATHADSLRDMIDIPLHCIVFATQVKLGMWRRNGHCMYDQLLNYSNAPYCRVFKDQDRLLIQFLLLKYPAADFVTHLFHRFVVKECLQSHDLKAYDSHLREADYFSGLLDESLQFLIHVCSELPPPPHMDPFTRLRSRLQKELIHRLIAGPATYSQIQECFSIYPDSQKIPSENIDEIIAEVADKQMGTGLKPPTFTLKKNFWSCYDPAFPHILDTAHQTAYELRPKLTCNQPIVPPPMESHPCFQSLSHRLLLDASFLNVMRDLYLAAAAERCKSPEYQAIVTSWTIPITESVYARLIHIMTLILHVVAEGSAQPHEVRGSNLDGRKDFLADFILLQPILPNDVENNLPRRNSLPSLLCALVDLKAHYSSGSTSSDRAYWLGWILDQCAALSPQCKSFIEMKLNTGTGTKTQADMEAMKQKTREKALAEMKASAEAFMSAFGDISDSEDEDEDNCKEIVNEEDPEKMILASDNEKETDAPDPTSSVHSPTPSSARKSNEASGLQLADESSACPRCIICHQGVEGGGNGGEPGLDHLNPMGYLALCQSSTALFPTHPAAKISEPYYLAPAISYDKTEDLNKKKRNHLNECNMHVSFCGHAMHYSCAEEYGNKVLPRSNLYKSMYLDIEGKQFPCPLCKKLNNILIPFVTSTSPLATADNSIRVVESSHAVDMLDWIRAPSLSPDKKTSGLKRTRMESESDLNKAAESGDSDVNQVTRSVEYEVIMHIDTRYTDFREATIEWPERYKNSSLTEISVFYTMLLNRTLQDFSGTVFDVSFAQPVSNRKHLFSKGSSAGGVVSLSSNDVLQDMFSEKFTKDFKTSPSEAHSLSKNQSGESTTVYQPLFDMIPHLEILVSAVAYTICCDCACRKAVTPESQFLHKIVDVVTWTLIHNNCQYRVSEGLMQLLKGGTGVGAKGADRKSDDSSLPLRDKYHQIHWMSSFLDAASSDYNQCSLLSVPLFDFLLLFIAVAQVDGRDIYSTVSPIDHLKPLGAEKASYNSPTIEYSISWICIAKLVQIVLTNLPELIECEKNDSAKVMFDEFPSFASLIREVYGRLVRSGLLERVTHPSMEKSAGADTNASKAVQNVFLQWLAFLQAVENLLIRIPWLRHIMGNAQTRNIDTKADDLNPPRRTAMDTERDLLEQLQVLNGLDCLLKFCLADGSESKASKSSFFGVIDGWIEDFLATMHQTVDEKQEVHTYLPSGSNDWTVMLSTAFTFYPIQVYKYEVGRVKAADSCAEMACYSTYPYPLTSDKPRLVDLPREYTKLHATICARTEYKYDHPAICLVCGTLLNSGGMRQCSLHAQTCNGADGGGVFFLLQECTVVLCSGYRCAYFPTPYVDIYGESHDNFRGKPLHLDNRIYGMINTMWLEHKISREIYSIRTSSNRLIILGYY